MPGRDRGLERVWRRRVRVQRTSGLSVRAFCELEGLAESAFYFWRRELLRRDAERTEVAPAQRPRSRSASETRPRFVPVVTTELTPARATSVMAAALPASGPVIELVHPGGIVVRVPAGCDVTALEAVLSVLDERVAEARPC